ncbi:hypothetical protein [Paraferrimonas haliotis]|uniref:Glyceraldehyde-3-phosphate dehydrogenase n=1 Tax=Paraferrimonas haliotis TaxID=2013866 RepID=A0AA37WWE2_9GAMM|nr:hypothetical protein [Paraferrimonas haliotis]GLS83372.1 glyceraldehyde-3-phosphate dehydrogenase [Paraferrimonas haliotis]
MKLKQLITSVAISALFSGSVLATEVPVSEQDIAKPQRTAEPSNFIGDDGKLDVSNWLSQAYGFLPVPIMVTEPAVGYGGGLAVVFLSDSLVAETPPDISGIFSIATENGSKVNGGFYQGYWKNDSIRYEGMAVLPEINLAYYGDSTAPLFDYKLKGAFLDQTILFRVNESPLFLGASMTYFDGDNSIRGEAQGPIPSFGYQNRVLSGAVELLYDTHDNHFSPKNGYKIEASLAHFEGREADSNYNYQKAEVKHVQFWELQQWVLGLKVSADVVDGQVPFYARPFISLRGIPAMRYQGDQVVASEFEARRYLDSRWSVLGFAGAGSAADKAQDLFKETQVAGGAGFRYLIADKYGMEVGMDLARGPEETTVHIQFGSSW